MGRVSLLNATESNALELVVIYGPEPFSMEHWLFQVKAPSIRKKMERCFPSCGIRMPSYLNERKIGIFN
jgi:hypothetical protein